MSMGCLVTEMKDGKVEAYHHPLNSSNDKGIAEILMTHLSQIPLKGH